MFLSAKAFFEDNTLNNRRLLIRAETQIPQEWLKRFRRNVAPITPMKSGRLRRSIITRQVGNTAEVSWRAPYAAAQHDGGHTQTHYVRGINRRDGGGGTIAPGSYTYSKFSSQGRPKFGSIAFRKTNAEMPSIMRELGLTK